MRAEIVDEITRNIDLFLINGEFSGKKVIIAPVNNYLLYTITILETKGFEIVEIFDNKLGSADSVFKEKKIVIPHLLELNDIAICLVSKHAQLIREQLIEIGCRENQIFVLSDLRHSEKNGKEISLFQCAYIDTKIREGVMVFQKWRREAKNKKIFAFPYPSLGDIYILGLFRIDGCNKFCVDYQLIVVGGACEKVARMMGFTDIKVVGQEEMDCACALSGIVDMEESGMEILHFAYHHTNLSYIFFDIYKYHFIEMYKELVFGQELSNELPEKCHDFFGRKVQNSRKISEKVIILAPYAKSVACLPDSFWETICEIFKAAGYRIYTNVAGKKEYPVKGSDVINFSLDEAIETINSVSAFIGLRSGLCDVISMSDTPKLIIYPPKPDGHASMQSIYGMGKIPGAVNYMELEYNTAAETIQSIVKWLQIKK